MSLAAAFGMAVAAAAYVHAADTKVEIGKPVPDFSLSDENGATHKLSDLRGQVVVLEWTNQNCPFVKGHYKADTMEKLATQYGAKGVTWVAVNSTSGNKPEETLAWKKSEGFQYVTLQDGDGKVGKLFNAKTTPDMYVIDAKGVLVYSGAIDADRSGPTSGKISTNNYVDSALQAVARGETPNPAETEPYGCSVKYSASN